MTVMPCPAPTEQLVHDIFQEVNAQAQAGTLTRESLALGVMALQDWNQYLDNLLDSELEITEAGTAFDELDLDQITEGTQND